MKKQILTKQKGITLIALVITNIVLLILAGVSIATLTGENGILTRAEESKEQKERAEIIENAKFDISAKQIENKGTITDIELIEILTSNKYKTQGTLSDNGEESVLDKTLTSNDGKHDIPVREIYDGDISSVKLISFTIYGTEYKALEGMTWKEWVDSEYNTGSFIYDEYSGFVEFATGAWVGANKKERILFSSKIKSGYDYYRINFAECVFPNSEILVSLDKQIKKAIELKEGDDIVYYDFETGEKEVGKIEKVYIHKSATNFIRYTFEDGTYLEATDYHPIYTKEGWKSYTERNEYEKPIIGDEVKTSIGWKKIINIETYNGIEDCYDFSIKTKNGNKINNYYANDTLVQGAY